MNKNKGHLSLLCIPLGTLLQSHLYMKQNYDFSVDEKPLILIFVICLGFHFTDFIKFAFIHFTMPEGNY